MNVLPTVDLLISCSRSWAEARHGVKTNKVINTKTTETFVELKIDIFFTVAFFCCGLEKTLHPLFAGPCKTPECNTLACRIL
jgi:hypothetical protein